MRQLHEVLADKVKWKVDDIKAFSQVPDQVVFNGTGLGSPALTGDDQFVSVQGHLILLKDQVPADLEYMLLTYGRRSHHSDGL